MLTTFPFSGGGHKNRPALVLHDSAADDVILLRITSQLHSNDADVAITDWHEAGLLTASVVRVNKIATIEKQLIARRLGLVSDRDGANVRQVFQRVFVW